MFFATSLYNFATSRNESSFHQPSKSQRVKRGSKPSTRPLSPPPSYESVAQEKQSPVSPNASTNFENLDAKRKFFDEIIAQEDLYKVLDTNRNAKPEEIRRAFLQRSRMCHPDKFPSFPTSTLAFQKVAFAYETLSKPSSRRVYDASGRSDYAAAVNTAEGARSYDDGGDFGEETLNSVLYSILCEFLEGDFNMIRVLVQALNEGNSGIQVGTEAVENLEGAFRKVREMLRAGELYVHLVHMELIRLFEIQQNLRSLSYFDVFGRLRLTLQLARVTLGIPMVVDQAMKATDGASGKTRQTGFQTSESEPSSSSEGEHSFDQDFYETKRTDADADVFGVAAETFEPGADTYRREEKARRRAARARRRAREAAAKQNLEGQTEAESKPFFHRGLFGPTATSLLKGVINVLETGEAWVPG